MTQTWFDKTCDARNELRIAAAELSELAISCDHVGLGIADHLHRLATIVWDAEGELAKAIGQGMDEECQTARAAVLNIGPACLDILKKEITE